VQCYKCKEWRHIKRDCLTWDKKDSKSLESSTALAGNTEDPEDILTIFREDTHSQDDWVLDSGATNHICSRRKFLETFQESKEGTFFLPSGSKCDIMGLGTVKVKMFDGVVHTLGGVAYISKLRKNLISLSQLNSKGCKCPIAGGAMKITRGCMVVMKGEKCGGIYRLVGTTVGKTKISKVFVKQGAQDIMYLRRVSFAGIAKTQVDCFQDSGDSEKENPTGEEVKSGSLFGIN